MKRGNWIKNISLHCCVFSTFCCNSKEIMFCSLWIGGRSHMTSKIWKNGSETLMHLKLKKISRQNGVEDLDFWYASWVNDSYTNNQRIIDSDPHKWFIFFLTDHSLKHMCGKLTWLYIMRFDHEPPGTFTCSHHAVQDLFILLCFSLPFTASTSSKKKISFFQFLYDFCTKSC